jgi:hypothetical protein
MRVDVRASERLTRGIARGRRVEARERERRRVDERFDPAKSLAATVRYLNIARDELAGRDDLAVAGYHMGIGNLQTALARFERGTDIPYAELYFGTTPLSAPRTHAFLASLGDDSATYLWRVRAAQRIMAMWRRDAPALAVLAGPARGQELRGGGPAPAEHHGGPRGPGRARGGPRGRPPRAARPAALGEVGPGPRPRAGELAGRLDREPALYRAARPQVLAVLGYLGTGVREISGARRPLTVTSAVRDREYQALLTRRNIEATRRYSLHTTGWAVDVSRRYSGRRQAQAFQFMLDRLAALDLIAWVREPAAIHFTVAGDAGRSCATGSSPGRRGRPVAGEGLVARGQLGVHVALHHLQRGRREVRVDRRDGVRGHRHLEVADVGVQRRVQDALLGHLPAEHDALDPARGQQVGQRRLEEDGVPRLDDERRSPRRAGAARRARRSGRPGGRARRSPPAPAFQTPKLSLT